MLPDLSVEASVSRTPSLLERIGSLNSLLKTRRIESTEELEELYSLRYRCYTKEGSIGALMNGRFVDEYDALPATYNIGIYRECNLVAAIRIAVLSDHADTSSSMRSFGDLVSPIIDRGETVIDPSRFVIDHDFSRSCPDMPYLVLRIPFMAGGFFGASTILATVRSEHMAFYKRVLQCEKVADPRPYLGLNTPLNLMTADYPVVVPKIIRRYPSFAYQTEEPMRIFGGVSRAESLPGNRALRQVA